MFCSMRACDLEVSSEASFRRSSSFWRYSASAAVSSASRRRRRKSERGTDTALQVAHFVAVLLDGFRQLRCLLLRVLERGLEIEEGDLFRVCAKWRSARAAKREKEISPQRTEVAAQLLLHERLVVLQLLGHLLQLLEFGHVRLEFRYLLRAW